VATIHSVISRQISVGGPCTIHMTSQRYDRITFVSVINEATKFVRPHKSRMRMYIIELTHCGQVISP
jgi:hypothetical protein